MTRIQAILFDFGGTLDGNGLHWRERAYRFIRSKFPHVRRKEFDQADRASVEKFVASGDGPACSLRQTADAIFAGIYERLELNPRIRDVFLHDFCRDAEQWLHENRQWLASLRTDYRLGVISNNFGNTKGWCDHYSLSPLLDVMLILRSSASRNPIAVFLERRCPSWEFRQTRQSMSGIPIWTIWWAQKAWNVDGVVGR